MNGRRRRHAARRRMHGAATVVASIVQIRRREEVFAFLDAAPPATRESIDLETVVEVVLENCRGERRYVVLPFHRLATWDAAWVPILHETGWLLERPPHNSAWK